jgi:hypothetical protein
MLQPTLPMMQNHGLMPDVPDQRSWQSEYLAIDHQRDYLSGS